LTPVIAAIVADPATKAAVDDVVGRSTSATVSPRLIPNSPLLFSVQINGSSPEETFAVAQAYETVMPRVAKVAEVLSGSGAKLGVVTGAEKTEQGQGLTERLIVLGSGAAGLLVFGAIAWACGNRRRWVRAS
ncbi:hypothetical protein, partial [Neisseria meningitidis]|uniref:hypothetical protein n=1 Tax=Neisseria meningitidis TaxID=487 RepID=UPI001303FB0D